MSVSDRNIVSIPTVSDSILTFTSFQHLWDFIDYLKTQESDTAVVNTAFTKLNINTNSTEGGNYTDHPVCLKFEYDQGYVSKRRIEEDYVISQLNSGDDVINSIVGNPYWKSVLNKYGALRIDNRIYRFFDDGGIVIIANNDLFTYAKIKNLPFESISERYNLRKSSEERENWSKFYNLSTDGQISSLKKVKDVKINALNIGSGKFQVLNCSFYESSSVVFEWVYPNGTTSTGLNPNGTFNENDLLKLKVHHDNGSIETINVDILICIIDAN